MVAPALGIGGTDARHYERLTENVFRFSPLIYTGPDLLRIHGKNERVSVKGLERAVQFYIHLLRSATE